MPTWAMLLCAGSIAMHAAYRLSVTHDEAAHVPAGLAYWQYGAFDIYPHNPPLIKLCLSLPLVASGMSLAPESLLRESIGRSEWWVGQEFLHSHYNDARIVYFRCRLVSILFYLWGGWLIGRWSGELFGPLAKLLGAALWLFHPLVLAHATVATPDLGAAVLALAAVRSMAQQIRAPSWRAASRAGVLLGLAELAKFTLLVLYPVWLALAAADIARTRREPSSRRLRAVLCAYAIVVSFFVVCAGYAFRGVGEPLASRAFVSSTFRRAKTEPTGPAKAALSTLGSLAPVPYLSGLDLQWADVEHGWPNYFHGSISNAGWWYYYPVALMMKTPVPFWIVVGVAVGAALRGVVGTLEDEAAVFLAPLAIAVVLQCNVSLTFLRYMLPAVPFLCVWSSRCAAVLSRPMSVRGLVLLCATAATVASSLLQHPDYLGYFNLAVGGPRHAWPWFSDGEVDWGQDLLLLKEWQQNHPHARPMSLALFSPMSPPYAGLVDDTAKGNSDAVLSWPAPSLPRVPRGPSAGYLAVSVTLVNRVAAGGRASDKPSAEAAFCNWLKERPPDFMIGSSILVFRFSQDDVRAWSDGAGGSL